MAAASSARESGIRDLAIHFLLADSLRIKT